MAGVTTALSRIGSDPGDDQELRQKKKLLVLLSVLIAPMSFIWGILYLALGSWVGIAPLLYCAISVASLVVFGEPRASVSSLPCSSSTSSSRRRPAVRCS
jgi:hypothetical protein